MQLRSISVKERRGVFFCHDVPENGVCLKRRRKQNLTSVFSSSEPCFKKKDDLPRGGSRRSISFLLCKNFMGKDIRGFRGCDRYGPRTRMESHASEVPLFFPSVSGEALTDGRIVARAGDGTCEEGAAIDG